MNKSKNIMTVVTAATIGFMAVVSLAWAGAEMIQARRDAMKGMGGAMKTINTLIESNGPVADAAAPAQVIADTTQKIPNIFPADSQEGDTKALPEIWANPDDFAAKAKDAQEQSAMLVTAVAGGDMAAVKAQFEKVGATCGACHKAYRAK
jgi:cytochrome c556